MQLLLFTWTLLTFYIWTVASQPCSTPSGETSNCVPIQACSHLLSDRYRETWKDYVCGYDESFNYKVCCPSNTCTTPDGIAGNCTTLHTCSRLKNMLIYNFSNSVVQYVAQSRCTPTERNVVTVCCSSQPELPSKVTPSPTSSNKLNGPPQPNRSLSHNNEGNKKNTEQTNMGRGKCHLNANPPDPSTNCCGVQATHDTRIIGGTATGIDQYPWLALIEYFYNNAIHPMCGGALISGRYVLTAAHCLTQPLVPSANPVNVRLGEYNRTTFGRDCIMVNGGGVDCTEGEKIIPIEKIIPHDGYNISGWRRNDIGLVRLAQTVQYTDFIRPICLPPSDFTTSPPLNLMLHVAGWGTIDSSINLSDVKMKVSLPYTSLEQCQSSYTFVQLWEGQVCAGGVKGKDSCKGDSGGPLMSMKGLRHDVVGVVSYGPMPCGLKNVPSIYTKVHHYLPWIFRQIEN